MIKRCNTVLMAVCLVSSSLLPMELPQSKQETIGAKLVRRTLGARLHQVLKEFCGQFGVDDQLVSKVKKLIQAGVDINVPNEKGETPLIIAVQGSQFKLSQLLIEQGADITAVDRRGETVLSCASEPLPGIAELIVKQMVRMQIPVQMERVVTFMLCLKRLYPFYYCHLKQLFSPVLSRLCKEERELKVYKEVEAIYEYASYSHRGKYALLEKCFPQLMLKAQETALMRNARRGDKKICGWLLEQKTTNIHQATGFGITALHEAARGGRKNICELFVAHGANPFCVESEGMTPFELAALPVRGLTEKAQHKETCEFLIEKMLADPVRADRVRLLVDNLKNDLIKKHVLEKYFTP